MGEIIYQGEPPFHLAITRAVSARGDSGTVELIAYGSVHGREPTDFPVRIPMSLAEARSLADDLRQAMLEAQKRMR